MLLLFYHISTGFVDYCPWTEQHISLSINKKSKGDVHEDRRSVWNCTEKIQK
jgi:hypothetical protein